jgi:hypothetical protein
MIKLVFEKVIVDNKRMYILKEFDCLTANQLPEEYFNNRPYVYKTSDKELVVKGKDFVFVGLVNCPFSIDMKNEIVHLCKISGIKLKKINQKIRDEWTGIETIEM